MKYEAIMFDLDGTLLPMDYDVFVKGYFKELAAKLSPLGIEPRSLIDAVWAGTKTMVKNDGSRLNIDAFWDTFVQLTGKNRGEYEAISDDFYVNEFNRARRFAGENVLAPKAVKLARQNADKVVLASNPLFPRNGQITRMSWVGLSGTEFDHITSYESERFSKPNPAYYTELCKKLNVVPENCLMIGNDEREDMKAASEAGLNGFLVTDCLIKCEDFDWDGSKGNFEQLIEYLGQ